MAGRIPQHFVDELVARADIVDIVGSRIALKKAGKEYKARCPFHDEKTPSFTVSQDKQFYHCFGCGAHGTVLGFLMEYEHMGFVEAVEDVASQLGLEIPREQVSAEEQRGLELYDLVEQAARFFTAQLKRHEHAQEYLKGRGISGETARDFRVGFAPDRWDALLSELGTNEDSRRQLIDAGLTIRKEQGREYDRFRDRVMFPIRDARGRVIGFGGRVLDQGEPKYLNSPETPLFHKGRELYGLYEARQALRDLPRLLVVEGYMDVIGLAQHGIRYAVATLGTATTPDHLKRMFRITGEVLFCFDGDRAGRQAAWRALENALGEIREGRQIRFLFLPQGEDPDSMVRQEGRESFEARFDHAVPLSDFLLGHLAEQADLRSIDGRARLAELARPLVMRIPPGIYREMLIDQLAEKVAMDPVRMRQVLQGHGQERRPATRTPAPGPRGGERSGLMRRAITLLLHNPQIGVGHEPSGELQAIDTKGLNVLLELLENCRSQPNISTAGLLERWRDRPEGKHLSRLAATEILVADEAAAVEFEDTVKRLIQEAGPRARTGQLLEKARNGSISDDEKAELQALLHRRGAPDDHETD